MSAVSRRDAIPNVHTDETPEAVRDAAGDPAATPFVVANATVLDASGCAARRNVYVESGRIADVRMTRGAPSGAIPRVEANGRLLIPAFRDAHCHLVFAGLLATRPALGGARSKDEVLERVARAIRDHDGDGTLVAEGWDESEWAPGEQLHRADLDRLSRELPLVARRACGHVAVVSSRALALVPRTSDVDMQTGTLHHEAAMRVESHLPGLETERRRALSVAVATAHRTGVTEVRDFCTLHDLAELRAAAAEGRLPLRVRGVLRYDEWIALAPSDREAVLDPDGPVPVVGLKLFADGTIGSESAAVGTPYLSGGEGTLMLDGERIASAARTAHAAGLPIAVHAIGDRAVTAVLDGLERAGTRDDRMEHAELIARGDDARMAELSVTASMQPNFVARFAGPGGLYARRLGDERARRTNPFGTLHRRGVRVCFGSDGMPIGPLAGLTGALGHPDPLERLTGLEALRAYSRLAPDGGVARDACADLVLLSVEGPSALAGAAIERVWLSGRPVGPPARGAQ